MICEEEGEGGKLERLAMEIDSLMELVISLFEIYRAVDEKR